MKTKKVTQTSTHILKDHLEEFLEECFMSYQNTFITLKLK